MELVGDVGLATRNGLGDQETLGKELDLVHLWRF
jgi:hypothetical protein